MAEEIRGLSVKFDADFSEFKKGMKDAEKDIKSTQGQMKTLQESLKLKWDNSKFEKAQEQAQKALMATEQKADLLRQRLISMESVGVTDETRDEFNYLAQQLDKTELSAQKLRKQLEDLEDLKFKNLTAGIEKAADSLDRASKATSGLSKVSGAALAGMAALGLKTVEQADEVATLATTYNMSAEALQRFNYVALQTDTESEALYKGFVKVQAGVADLKSGVESVSTKALKELNLSFENFDGSEEQFYAIIDALSNMEDQAKMVSLANDIFGERMATGLLPFIYAGTDAINEYKSEFDELGSLTDEQVEKLAEFDNVLNKLKTQFVNVGLQLGQSLLPVMEYFADTISNKILPKVQKFSEWFDKLSPRMKTFIVYGLAAVAMLSPMLSGLSKIVGVLPNMIKGFNGLGSAFSAISKHPIILILAVIAALLILLYARNEEFRESVNDLLGLLSDSAVPVLRIVQQLLGNILSLIGPLIDSLGNQLAPVLQLVYELLLPIFDILEQIFLFIEKINDGLLALAGKGWLWGTDPEISVEDKSTKTETDIQSIVGDFNIPEYPDYSSPVTNNSSNYVDNSNIVINIEKNEYMNTDDIIKAVNIGLKQAKQART